MDFVKLRDDLYAAREAAHAAADRGDDSGSCNFDGVRLFGVRWSQRFQKAASEAGVKARRTSWLGRSCVDLGFGAGGQAARNTRAMEAAHAVLCERGWDASMFYMAD